MFILKGNQMKKLKERIKELRLEKNIMQKEMSETIGIAPRTLRGYEGGTREPNIDKLIEIANYFDVSLDYLVGRSDNPKGLTNDISSIDKDEGVNLKAISDTDLKRWYEGLPLSQEEDLKKLRAIWEIINK